MHQQLAAAESRNVLAGCPPHWWLIDGNNVGECKKCAVTRKFKRPSDGVAEDKWNKGEGELKLGVAKTGKRSHISIGRRDHKTVNEEWQERMRLSQGVQNQ